MRNKRYFVKNVLCLFLLAFSVFSCSENALDDVTKTQKFDHLSARSFFERNISALKIPDMFISEVETRANDAHFNGYRVDWDKFNYSENDRYYIYEFDLSTVGYELFPVMFSNDNGNISHIEQNTKIRSSLVIMKSKTIDSLRIFVNTLVGYMTNNEDLCTFNEDKSDFIGFQVFTDCEGNYLPSGYLYEEGTYERLHLKKYENNEYSQLPSTFFRVYMNVCTKGNEIGKPMHNWVCEFCGYNNSKDADHCFMCGRAYSFNVEGNSGIIGGAQCPHCGMNPCICDPCLRCGYDPCVCPDPNDGCIYCLSEDCSGECRN